MACALVDTWRRRDATPLWRPAPLALTAAQEEARPAAADAPRADD